MDSQIKSNYHSHSTFCDGRFSIREMAEAAVKKNFTHFGFSGHSMFPFAGDWHIPLKDFKSYVEEVRVVKNEFKDKIKFFLGFEADYIQGICFPDFSCYSEFSPDYLIGSVHYIPGENGFIVADDSPDEFAQRLNKYFKGNVKSAVCEYFYNERQMLSKCSFSILGHPDLIKKQNARYEIFSENESWYKKELKAFAREIARSGVCVEINTGGIARSNLKEPYPSLYFLELLKEKNVPVTINSDAHDADKIDYWFAEAESFAIKAGYKEIGYFENGQLKFRSI